MLDVSPLCAPAFHTEAESARLATVLQENTVLKSELDMVKLKYKNIAEENRRLRQASVNIVSHSTHTKTSFLVRALGTRFVCSERRE